MIIALSQTKMSQYVVFVSWWLLAVVRGSGLTGLPPREYGTTTPMPHSPRPPPTTTSLPTLEQDSQNRSLVNLSLSFYPLHVNNSGLLSGTSEHAEVLTRPVPTKSTSSTLTTTPTTPFTTNLSPQTTLAVLTSQTITQETQGLSKNLSNTVTISVNPTISVKSDIKEQVRVAPQSSQKEWFIRRKHKGPYHADRVKKLSATLSASAAPGDASQITHRTANLTETAVAAKHVAPVDRNGKSATKVSRSRSTLSKPTRRPHHTLTSTEKQHQTTKVTPVERPRKRPITMGIPASSTVLLSRRLTTTPAPTVETYNPPESDEYYSSYGEYPDLPILGYNASGYSEAAVLPDPDTGPVEEEAEAEVVLPDDSLADTDLHDHDLIDSVMYIYFGSSERDERGAGRQVLIVGAVISLVAQFLTLVSVLRRLRSRPDESASLILLNAELALTAGNLVFMLGVQATGSKRRCELVAVTLHYLHLVTCCWFLVNSMFSYCGLQQSEVRRRLRPWWVVAWCGPALIVMLCVVFNKRGYETRAFCWVSVARGMLYSFMVPVAALILLNTCFAVLGLRQLSLSPKTEDSDRKSMRISATLLPVFAVVWFLGVVALENSASLVFPLLFVASNGFLNWFVLACWLPADMSLWRESDEEYDDEDDDLYEEVLKTHTDAQPLLEEPHIYVCGRRELCELQMDPICTISS